MDSTKTSVRKITIGIIGVTITALIGWDIYAESNGEENTISDIIHSASKKCMAIPLFFGMLMGHFFLRIQDQ